MSSEEASPATGPVAKPVAYVIENGLLVFTEAHHLERGFCCGSGCRHCPFEPRHVEGNTQVRG